MQIPPGNETVDNYIKRLSSGIENQIDVFLKCEPGEPIGLQALLIDATGECRELVEILIDQKSDLWPRGKEEAVIGVVASYLAPSVWIRKQPISPEMFEPIHTRSDFEAYGRMPGDRAVLVWNRKKSQLCIWITKEYNSRLWYSSGKITSLMDLYGSQIFILPTESYTPDAYTVLSRSLELCTVWLTFAEGRSFSLSGRKFKKNERQTWVPGVLA